jgi:hypothetical protein
MVDSRVIQAIGIAFRDGPASLRAIFGGDLNEQERKEVSDYDPRPPSCASCINRCEKRVVRDGKRSRIEHHCSRHNFAVHVHGICNDWTRKNGETLK